MPSSEPTPTPAKTPTSPGLVNKKYTASLQKAADVLGAALDAQYNAQIVDGVEITPAFLTALGTKIDAARTYLSATTSARGAKKSSTAQESAAKTALSQALQGIQTRAYQKFHATNADRVQNTYFGGTDLFKASDALMPQIVTSFLENAANDALPKVDAARITNLQNLFDAWEAARGEQGTTGGASITDFEQFKTALTEIEAKRRTIQFAADDDFPYYEPMNKAAREAFKIELDGPFRG